MTFSPQANACWRLSILSLPQSVWGYLFSIIWGFQIRNDFGASMCYFGEIAFAANGTLDCRTLNRILIQLRVSFQNAARCFILRSRGMRSRTLAHEKVAAES